MPEFRTAWKTLRGRTVVAIISLLVALTLSLLITRVATVALTLTGLSRESARFQARSAFTGVGFTTGESESIVKHPVRRRIVMLLMLLGNVGIATVIATLMLSFFQTTDVESGQQLRNLLMLAAGIALLWIFANSKWVDRRLSQLITWALGRWTSMEVRDYVSLFQLASGYAVLELQVELDDWLAEKTLKELRLADEGVLVLGIHRRDGAYIGAPTGTTHVEPFDTLILYGTIRRVQELDRREKGPEGFQAHLQAVSEQRELLQGQEKQKQVD